MRTIQNPMCGGAHCHTALTSSVCLLIMTYGEVRILPTGGDSNAIMCHACYLHEMNYRRDRNKQLGTAFQFELPEWESLRVYEEGN